MKKIITAFIFCFLFSECFSQAGEWVWIKGDSVPNQAGSYGVQGVPSPTNNPPSLYASFEWTDLNGNFWLFGGGDDFGNFFNDLWKYSPLTNEWTWIKGPGVPNGLGNYGTQGIPSSTNNPPARETGASWIDNQGDLWFFGGYYWSSDLWKYNISTNEWTWMKGPNTVGQSGIYGTQGVPDPANNPGARGECTSAWSDNIGNLWLFGGHDDIPSYGEFNDLWKFNIATNEWTWMKGSQFINQSGTYGILGTENISNTPGARGSHNHWKDSIGNFWFSSWFYDPTLFHYNDLWRYNPITNNWAWMSGDSVVNSSSSFGTKCLVSSTNIPASRYENRASWTDKHGNFWFFGGGYGDYFTAVINDLWMYCISTNQWVWQSGDTIFNPNGSWGTQGVSSPNNKPNGRAGSVGWTDFDGNFYLFGGSVHNRLWYHNDLWKYTIDTTCGVCPIPNSIQENNFTNKLLVFPNPTNSSLSISFSSSEKQNVELRIYNTLGKQIYFEKEEITKGKFEKEINVGKWSEGIYFLQVKTKEGNMNRKVIVNH